MGKTGRALLVLSTAMAGGALAVPRAVHADCRPIHVVVQGTVTSKADRRPLPDLPVTIRIGTKSEGLTSVEWGAVVTDRQGHFQWSRDFPADPCHHGKAFLHFPSRLGGKLRHPMSRAYRFGAGKLPWEIALDTMGVIHRVRRAELLQLLDPKTRVVKVQVNFTL